jgi:hypothetical protein
MFGAAQREKPMIIKKESCMTPLLSLKEAIETDRLREFITQEEARGIGPANRKKLDSAIKRLATTPLKSKGRTSRSTSGGGSSGK